MHPSVTALFQFACRYVTDEDIKDYSPSDPGYGNYVRRWSEILSSGTLPRECEFDLSEVICLTGYHDPEKERAPQRFRNYRRFTSAVALGLIHAGNYSEDVRRPANYLARDLIVDATDTSKDYLKLVRSVFEPTREILTARPEEQFPFFTFGSMILAQRAKDYLGAERAASKLIEDEATVRADDRINYLIVSSTFLLGLTVYDQHHEDWISFAKRLKNPRGHEDTQLIIEALVLEGS